MKLYRFTLFISSLLVLNNLYAQTIDCTGLPQWSAASIYGNNPDPTSTTTPKAVIPDRIVYQGVAYHSNFWTQNNNPATYNNTVYGFGQPWTIDGTCSAGTVEGFGKAGSTDSWDLAGNSITQGQFIGTTNNDTLVFKANNIPGLYVNPLMGSVSVGKAVYPNYYKFEVNGGLSAFSGPNQALQNNLLVVYSGNQNTAKYRAGYRHYVGFAHGLYPSGEEYAALNAYEYNANTTAGAGKHMLIQNTNEGNLGVGLYAAAPSHKLSVNGNAAIDGSDLVLGRLDGRAQGTILFNRALVHNNTGDALVINYNGDFEGGVQVQGKGLVAKQICVNLTMAWCDYVFEENYKLMPLKELKTFINKYKHLPEIPSAQEMEKEGLNVNNLLTLQMKKIEELSLYAIEQDAKIKAQEIKVQDLEERLKQLEELVVKTR
jgi:hypothetical protein